MEKQNALSSTTKAQIDKLLKSAPGVDKDRACLFNLIVYSHEPRRTQYLKEIVQTVVSQFPCRVFFIQANPSAREDSINIKVSTEKATEEQRVFCYQIFIEANGKDVNKVNFLLLPLFVPDLPIYLLWGQDPTAEYTILPHLQHFATRLIIDSEATEDLQLFARDIQNRMASTQIQIVDMNWARIWGWREVLAHVFDSPERFNQLTNTQMIEIFYNDSPSEVFLHPDTQAIYLQAWIASRLNWKYEKAEKQDNSQIIFYQSQAKKRQIKLTPKRTENFNAEEIVELTFTGPDYECHLKRLSVDHVQVGSSNQFQCMVPFILVMPTLCSGRSFMQEIFYQKVSNHYVEALKLISLVHWS